MIKLSKTIYFEILKKKKKSLLPHKERKNKNEQKIIEIKKRKSKEKTRGLPTPSYPHKKATTFLFSMQHIICVSTV